jgi:hypothetical protein
MDPIGIQGVHQIRLFGSEAGELSTLLQNFRDQLPISASAASSEGKQRSCTPAEENRADGPPKAC